MQLQNGHILWRCWGNGRTLYKLVNGVTAYAHIRVLCSDKTRSFNANNDDARQRKYFRPFFSDSYVEQFTSTDLPPE